MSEKIAVIMEFNGYTQDELQDYLTFKFVPMTKGGMTASFLSQTGYKRAKAVILDRPQLNDNQLEVLEWLKRLFGKYDYLFDKSIFYSIYDFTSDAGNGINITFEQPLSLKEEVQILQVFSQWALEQEEE